MAKDVISNIFPYHVSIARIVSTFQRLVNGKSVVVENKEKKDGQVLVVTKIDDDKKEYTYTTKDIMYVKRVVTTSDERTKTMGKDLSSCIINGMHPEKVVYDVTNHNKFIYQDSTKGFTMKEFQMKDEFYPDTFYYNDILRKLYYVDADFNVATVV